MDNPRDKHMEKHLKWILLVSLSPIAFLLFILMGLLGLLRFLLKTSLLFIIIAINTPFAVMYNVSLLVFEYNLARFRKSNDARWNWSDPRASLGIEVQLLVSDFFKVVGGELIVLMSAGIITYYTAPLLVFYVSTAISVVAMIHKWLNTDCLSKTALSCLCDGYGLSPLMFLISFIGFFDIGCHPVAKCSFAASRAFLFVKDGPFQLNEEDGPNLVEKPVGRIFDCEAPIPKLFDCVIEFSAPTPQLFEIQTDSKENVIVQGHNKLNAEVDQHRFKGAVINPEQPLIEFRRWNAFERGLFQLSPRIDFRTRNNGKCILKSSMVLRLLDKFIICEYPVERLELPEDYSKANELYNFLVDLSSRDGFVTDKMRGRYEHSLTLLQIAEGVEENAGYRIMKPMDARFVVAGRTNM